MISLLKVLDKSKFKLLEGNWFIDWIQIRNELGRSNSAVYNIYDKIQKKEFALKEVIVNVPEQMAEVRKEIKIF